ncbi:MAG TPA: hypothetical protein VIT43_15245, partial [Candidatus Dormibacteraeota bacterium]
LFIFLISAALYLAAAGVLVFKLGIVTNQALAVVANASYVLFSRDPHLAAIGFVTSPLPSAAVLPLLPFKSLWPALTEQALAAPIVSAFFMAGAVYQLYRLLRASWLSAPAAAVITGLFAIHPLIVFAAATGRGEAAYLFFLLLAARHLLTWFRNGDLMGGVIAGFALAGAYLARYDAVLVGIAAIATVFLLSLSLPRLRRRVGEGAVSTALCDAFIVGGPLVATIVLWGLSAWLVTGRVFPQLASGYGFPSQLQTLQAHLATLGLANLFKPQRIILQLVSLEPALPAALLVFALAAFSRRSRAWVSVTAVLGLALGAIATASLLGNALPWLSISVLVVPVVTLVLPLGLATPKSPSPRLGAKARGGGFVIATLMLFAAIPTTMAAMLSPTAAPEESAILRPLLHEPAPSNGSAAQVAINVAQYIDRQHYAEGTVLVDSLTGFPVILASRSPQQFVIPSDRDFALALSAPKAFRVEYLLVPAPASMNYLGSVDAINRAYPHLFDLGPASGELIHEFTGSGRHVLWRLYAVSAVEAPSTISSQR